MTSAIDPRRRMRRTKVAWPSSWRGRRQAARRISPFSWARARDGLYPHLNLLRLAETPDLTAARRREDDRLLG
jgi:hypothetical protein